MYHVRWHRVFWQFPGGDGVPARARANRCVQSESVCRPLCHLTTTMSIHGTDFRGSVEHNSNLLELPPEILNCIVIQNVQKGDCGNLRLVCRKLDDIAKHIVLATLALSRLRLSQLKELASSPSGFEEHATHLRFRGFCKSELRDQSNVSIKRHPSKDELEDTVCRIIRRMKKITHVVLQESQILGHSRPILETIGMLPLLNDVQLMMMQAGDEGLTTATNALSNLKSIRLVTSYSKAPDSTMENNLSVLLGSSPQLSRIHFTVGPPNTGDQRRKHYSLASIVTPITTQPHFRPSVRHLSARSLVILPTGPCLAYLGCLTSLCVSTVGQSDNIWPALHASKIMLEDITIDAVTERFVEYMLGYRGLNAFQANAPEMGWGTPNPLPLPDEQQVARLFDQALPHHNQSLKHVGIWFTKDSWGTHSVEKCWVLDAKQLEKLGRLSNLEKLAVSVRVDKHGVGVDLSMEEILTYIFTRLSSSLQEVQIRSSTSIGRSMHHIQLAVADYEFKACPSNIHACLVTRLPMIWFIAFDEAKQVYKFTLTDKEVLKRLTNR